MGPKSLADELNKDIVINREMRRQKPPTDNTKTKATHSIKKQRNKNVKKRLQHQRKLARARKNS